VKWDPIKKNKTIDEELRSMVPDHQTRAMVNVMFTGNEVGPFHFRKALVHRSTNIELTVRALVERGFCMFHPKSG